VIGSNSFDFDKCQQSPTWIRAINDDTEKIPETEEYGISSFVFRARKPFHPERLMEFVNEHMGQRDGDDSDPEVDEEPSGRLLGQCDSSNSRVLRSKGFFWLAARPTQMMIWSQAGGLIHISEGGPWWADTEKVIKNILDVWHFT
jgi:G3E family GTPase